MAQAVELVLRRRGFRAGRYSVGYQSCDDSIAQTGDSDLYKCAANARSFADDVTVLGVVGPFHSPCARVEIAIANRASLPMVSPSNSAPGLTRAGPGAERGEPHKYYPTGVRTYFRVFATDDIQAAAGALLAKQLGAKRVFVLRLFVTGYTSDIHWPWPRASSRPPRGTGSQWSAPRACSTIRDDTARWSSASLAHGPTPSSWEGGCAAASS